MDANRQVQPVFDFGETKITSILLVEHRLLRAMMEAVAEWLAQAPPTAVEAIRARSSLLGIGLEEHAIREEQQLFNHLRPLSERATHLVDMMVLVHDEVRSLLEEIETMDSPKEHLWTVLDLTVTHFVREEEQVFPLAEELIPPDTLIRLAAEG